LGFIYSLGRNDKFQLLDGVCDLLLWLYWMECELLGLGDVKFELRDPDFVVGWDKSQSRTQQETSPHLQLFIPK
jgi:hypothetical protein